MPVLQAVVKLLPFHYLFFTFFLKSTTFFVEIKQPNKSFSSFLKSMAQEHSNMKVENIQNSVERKKLIISEQLHH